MSDAMHDAIDTNDQVPTYNELLSERNNLRSEMWALKTTHQSALDIIEHDGNDWKQIAAQLNCPVQFDAVSTAIRQLYLDNHRNQMQLTAALSSRDDWMEQFQKINAELERRKNVAVYIYKGWVFLSRWSPMLPFIGPWAAQKACEFTMGILWKQILKEGMIENGRRTQGTQVP